MNKAIIFSVFIAIALALVAVQPGAATSALSAPTEHIPGQAITVTAKTLTIGSDYFIITNNDVEATTILWTATATTHYFTRSFEEDSDLSFGMKIFAHNGTDPGYAESTQEDAILLSQVKATTYINTDLFISFMTPLVLIGVVIVIVGALIWNKSKG